MTRRTVAPRANRWIFVAATLLAFPSCGRNKFAQELDLESAAIALARESKDGQYSLVTTKELYGRIKNGDSDFVLIDAMPAKSFAAEHIKGAKNFVFPKDAMNTWDAGETGGKTKDEYAELLGKDKSRPVVVYCGYVQCLRSHNAAMWAKRLGFEVVQRHPGGLFAWKGASYPLVASDSESP